ncbi:MAG: PD-(D/E)XK nuclease family protein [Kofleriaceae bacterium]|nr:PD-(D/E)XK nuclease family protein [Kofleriaceae bacterium]
MARRLLSASRAELRLGEVAAWLASRPAGEEVVVVGASADAAQECIRTLAKTCGTAFGFHAFTVGRLAAELSKLVLAERNLAVVGALPLEALCARVVDRLRRTSLVRFTDVIGEPGMPRALARTLDELRMARATTVDGDPDLTAALGALGDELAAAGLADRALVFAVAAEVAEADASRHALLGAHLVLVDVAVRNRSEERLLAAIASRAASVLATVAEGDERSERYLERVVGVAAEDVGGADDTNALGRVQRHLFGGTSVRAAIDDTVSILSAPGESRECVELARCVLREAERGVPFDKMAVLLRSPEQYRVHLEEAMARAKIPVHFTQGTRMPDPSGRAFLSLLACAAEGLSARRFAEYLSLGVVPEASGEAPPAASPASERWVPPDEELLPRALAAAEAEAANAQSAGNVRAPWRWEQLLVDAAVIGGRDRWTRRLDGLEAQYRLVDGDESEESRASRERKLRDLENLRSFALPLLDDLTSLPPQGTWRVWIDRLTALATRSLRAPERVLAVLSALLPMADVGPVDLREVREILHQRLTDLVVKPTGRRYGRLLIAPIAAARGMSFQTVFIPGLAERMFPQKIVEDPLLLDHARKRLDLDLEVRDHRLAEERLALRLAIGAAHERVVLSYPRIDLDQGRPRVPSFYGLEVLQAAEGTLPGFDELARRADVTGAARIGWPAPKKPLDAIDEAEHDLALLDEHVRAHGPAPKGVARYLLDSNPHLARALRTRARRWAVQRWLPADGLIVSTEAARAALAEHAPSARSFSPTALEALAACPYRFALKTILRLEPRETPEPIENLGPLERGSLIHQVQFELLVELRDARMLPVRAANLDAARDRLDAVLERVAGQYRELLHPAIERVWDDGIASIKADLREWLRRTADDVEWTPSRFELAFGLAATARDGVRDDASVEDPVTVELAPGASIMLRGSIDLVEDGAGGIMRATDHKTGKATVQPGSLMSGGKSLQPILYALVLEKLFPSTQVSGGRLYYCTTRGDFTDVEVPLDADARAAATVLVETLAHHFAEGFFPAAPGKDECKWCDFRPICGPYEEMRAKKKSKDRDRLIQLGKLRGQR